MTLRHHLEDSDSLAGHLLVAHPALKDPNFSRTIVLLSAHSETDGAVGVIVNRAMDQTLADLKEDFIGTPIAAVPVFFGGPVGTDDIILTAWHCKDGNKDLQLHFGISVERAEELKESDPDMSILAFLGYSGWSAGQVEAELADDAWVITPLVCPLVKPDPGPDLWKRLLRHIRPDLAYLADAPADPSLN